MVKVIFCLPGREYSREFLLSWSDLVLQASSKGHQVMMSQQYSSVVHFARAKCLGGNVLKGKDQKPFQGEVEYDAIMWIDSDIVFRPDDFFAMLESPHDVTAGMYLMEDMKHFAIVKDWDEEFFKKNGSFDFLTVENVEGIKKIGTKYLPVSYAGMGWMMIKKDVIEDLKYPWFFSELEEIGDLVDMNSEDVSFCKALAKAGHQVHVDLNVRVGHQKKMII